ncbi:trihelix transcription factor ASIL2 [Fagus crenata]
MASSSSPVDTTPIPSSPPTAVPLPIALPLPAPPQAQAQVQVQVQAQPQAQTTPSTTASRRLPPPCWSHDETVALIDSYREKWYSLRRGNLKATHWQEVADAVARRCSAASPAKTAVQCRHKMEKLRKRYRTELQRARSMPVSRFISSWVHFKRMDAMEKGPTTKPRANDSDSDENDNNNDLDVVNDDNDEEEDQDLYEEFKNGGSNMRHMSKFYRNNGIGGSGGGSSGGSGFRIRIPTGVSVAQPGSKFYAKVEQKYNSNPNPSSSSGGNFGARVMRECNTGRPVLGKRERERDPVAEMVSAIKVLGDGFVRVEKMKMEMARDIEAMRMEMEMKRTEMILESQQRIVEAFAKAVSEKKKKPKRIASPES